MKGDKGAKGKCYKPPVVEHGDLCEAEGCGERAIDAVKVEGVMKKLCYQHFCPEYEHEVILVRSSWRDPIYLV